MTPSLPQLIKKSWSNNKDLCSSDSTSGGGSLSSSSDSNKFKDITPSIGGDFSEDFVAHEEVREPDTSIPLILHEIPDSPNVTTVETAEDEDDFNIASEMFGDNVMASPSISKKDLKEESSDFISSTSSDSLNFDEFPTETQHIGPNHVVVKRDEDDGYYENKQFPDDVNSLASQPLKIPQQLQPSEVTATVTINDNNLVEKEESIPEVDEEKSSVHPLSGNNASVTDVTSVTFEEKPALDGSSPVPVNEERCSPSSSVDSGNDCSTSALAKELEACVLSQQQQSPIQLSDLQAALTLVQQGVEDENTVESRNVVADTGEAPVRSARDVRENEAAIKQKKSKKRSNKKDKSKKSKSKTKAKVTMNIQSVEAEAFSLFELAKSLLTQSRNANTGVFSVDSEEVSCTNNPSNRRLQLAAFEIGEFLWNVTGQRITI